MATAASPPSSPQEVHHDHRPRAHTVMSFHSGRSHRSSLSANRLELTESAKDKKRLHTKADPSKALNEATPAEQALEESTVDDLRKMVHKDSEGNIITEPDRSNPTRHRFERPLDTIRAFEAAAEGTTTRRASFQSRPASQVGWNAGDASRRASYYSNSGYSPQRPRPTPGSGYYRNSSYGFNGPQGSLEEAPGAAQMQARNGRPPSNAYGPPNGYHNGQPNGYPNGDSPISAHSYQQSYETMTSGSDDYSKSTNPSSQNSSFDQLHQLRKPEEYPSDNPYANELRLGQLSGNKQFSPYEMNNGYIGQGAPSQGAMQRQEYLPNNPRQPIKLNGSSSDPPFNSNNAKGSSNASTTPKKKSWIKRRFSRQED
ncbi:hypothetical protein HRR83_008173 [Exophiala dermatitidis]|uniref:Uncharacterized protein n=2 Tax=Exophiala dermatitidis TaxID=5970 RepID=H6BSU7_EXODN|nr:uncharacterized protein HMPREF1120_02421 [Exophiala dermatitidis NIH/UT8656]KAJ4507988.1 hypothetical protein HRR74_007873 [Exophiala dermatitidis]EHY54250.1 hypothetical protein HMPREF1120_02421 [Exophiala dermatitidis NIH/UT8656]KAJ4513603.1 hypothetical protein HRR73_005761 [Exophiala dermatitidis]KAJ4535554.1 hypothetical protein HRR77_007873 [Exophiala dermatitidis]KAJ4544478.1 hypothetical protein HRR76_002537 [Exophiala dermatitidis]